MTTRLFFHTLVIHFYLILFWVDMILVSGQCQIKQQSILIQFKNNLTFDSSLSTKLVSWDPNVTTDCCNWRGVVCSTQGQVIGLELSNETISSPIDDSSALFDLDNLERLNLAGNNFNFIQIPSRFASLSSLSYLNLSNSRFSGQIPVELSRLTKLEVLDLSEPFSFGTRSLKLERPNLSTLVQNLTRLTGLYLDNVNISSQRFNWSKGLSSSLPKLEVISLSNCELSGPLDDSLQRLQSLSEIYLALNDLSAPVPDFFASFKNLTVMNLGACNLNETFPQKVFQLQTLQSLDLAFQLSDLNLNRNLYGSLPDFPMNGSLRSLVLSNTNFYGGIPDTIGNLKNLSRLELNLCNFSGQIPKSMENLTQLVYLDLSSNNFSGDIPSFQMCKNLTHIDLSRNSLSGQSSSGGDSFPNITRSGASNSVWSHMFDDNERKDAVTSIIERLKARKSDYEAEIAERATVVQPTKIDRRYEAYLQQKVQWLQITINHLTFAESSIRSTIQHAYTFTGEFRSVGSRPDGYVTDPGEEYVTGNPEAASPASL